MKREKFKVRMTAKDATEVHVKHTWNAARRHIVTLVRVIAKVDGGLFALTDKGYARDTEGRHISGFEVWTNAATSERIRFEIEKVS